MALTVLINKASQGHVFFNQLAFDKYPKITNLSTIDNLWMINVSEYYNNTRKLKDCEKQLEIIASTLM